MKDALKKADELHEFEIEKYLEVIEILKAQNARYREALEFYADSTSWLKQISLTNYSPEPISMDCGLRAKEALKGE